VSALLLTSCSRFQDYRACTATTVVQPLSRLPCLHCCYRRAAAFKATVPVVVSTLPSSCLRHLCGAYATAMILLLSSGLRGHLRCVSADAVGFRRRQCAYADVVVSTLPSSCLRYLCGAFTTAMMLLLLLSSSLRGHPRCVSADAVGLRRRRGAFVAPSSILHHRFVAWACLRCLQAYCFACLLRVHPSVIVSGLRCLRR
jgi:hypothetical protein